MDALIKALDTTDPEIQKLTENPNVTEQEIRQAVRGLYDKANKILGGYVDPVQMKAFNQASKQAAMNGAPNPTAGTNGTVAPPSIKDKIPDEIKERLFLDFLD